MAKDNTSAEVEVIKKVPRHLRRQKRQENAIKQQEAANLRTPREQLAILATRGVTRGKEVDKLEELIYKGGGNIPLGKIRELVHQKEHSL